MRYRESTFFSPKKVMLYLILLISGCSTLLVKNYDLIYGEPVPRERAVASIAPGDIDYWEDVKPILDTRCVVCHGCYDAPCQLKLSSIEGLERGAHKTSVYNTTRLFPAEPTRLYEDANTVLEWRDRGFFPVLNERIQTPDAHKNASVMYQLLSLKEQHPLPTTKILDNEFSFGVGRKESCPKLENIDTYKRENPRWGMPYALPGLDDAEQSRLTSWLEQGARYTSRVAISSELEEKIATWELFLNNSSLKGQLVSRYIFEHLFLADLYFEGEDTTQVEAPIFFSLVRSRTPSDVPVDMITTRRPYDDPGVDKFFYRLVPKKETTVVKSHMPYALNHKRMQRWEQLFFNKNYSVSWLPTYERKQASNPFDSFSQLPMKSRYKFMLDEAQFTIMNYIKGPVCRGSVALNVINDHFWVFFLDPDLEINDDIESISFTNKHDLELPSTAEDSYVPLIPWRKYAGKEKNNRKRRDAFMLEHFSKAENKFDYTLIWDGAGQNNNAALTIFRHWDSASVEKGLLGASPKTSWVISYPLLEQIHYLLVAGYDVYGNLGHNLLSRLHMDFLRMEGESAFLMLLPQEARVKERNYWYRGVSKDVLRFLSNPEFERRVEPDITYKTDNPKDELYAYLKAHLEPVLDKKYDISSVNDIWLRTQLKRLGGIKGRSTTALAEVSFVEIWDASKNSSRYITILKNNAHLNISSLFGEAKQLSPEENSLTVVDGLLGAYPNVFLKVERQELKDFVDQMIGITDNFGYEQLLDDYGVRRTSKDFWLYSDRLHQVMKTTLGSDFGYLDYNRLENR